jgi:hypothetical protein
MTTTATENGRRILELLAQGKITVDEAEQLLRAVDAPAARPTSGETPGGDATRRWVRITIDKSAIHGRPPKQVSIRVPLALVRSGIKFGAMFPKFDPVRKHFRDHGIDADFSKIDLAELETMLGNLNETTIDVDGGKAQLRISYE